MGLALVLFLTALVTSSHGAAREHPTTQISLTDLLDSTGIVSSKTDAARPSNRNKFDETTRNETSPKTALLFPDNDIKPGVNLGKYPPEGTQRPVILSEQNVQKAPVPQESSGIKNDHTTSVHHRSNDDKDRAAPKKSDPSVHIISEVLIVPTEESAAPSPRSLIPRKILMEGHNGSKSGDLNGPHVHDDPIGADMPVHYAQKHISTPAVFTTQTAKTINTVTKKSIPTLDSREITTELLTSPDDVNTKMSTSYHSRNNTSGDPFPHPVSTHVFDTKSEEVTQTTVPFSGHKETYPDGTLPTLLNNHFAVDTTVSPTKLDGEIPIVFSHRNNTSITAKVTSSHESTTESAITDKLFQHVSSTGPERKNDDYEMEDPRSSSQKTDEMPEAENLETTALLHAIRNLQKKLLDTLRSDLKRSKKKEESSLFKASARVMEPATTIPKLDLDHDIRKAPDDDVNEDTPDRQSKDAVTTKDEVDKKMKHLEKLLGRMIEELVPLVHAHMGGMTHRERVDFLMDLTEKYKAAIPKPRI